MSNDRSAHAGTSTTLLDGVSVRGPVRVCAWCQRRINEDGTPGAPFVRRNETVTHGICSVCIVDWEADDGD